MSSINPSHPLTLSPHPLFDNYGNRIERAEALSALNLDAGFSYLLFFGFIRAYKGLDLLIEAFSDKKMRNSKLKLIVAGEFYEDDKPYRDLITKHKLQEEVLIFDHFIKDSEVSRFFSAADLVVQPYRSATQSGVTQIAFHFEVPMVVTGVGGLKEIVPDGICGYVVSPETGQITNAIHDFFVNNKSEQFREGIRRVKEKFSWAGMTGSIIEVCNKCAGKSEKI